MPITRTAQVDDDGSGTTGTILNNAWKQELYGQIDEYGGGVWTSVPFSAANFTASSGTWTVAAGHQVVYLWTRLSTGVVVVAFNLSGAMTISASTASLFISLPAPIPTPSISTNNPFTYNMTGANGAGYIEVQTTARRLRLLRDPGGTPFPIISSGNVYLFGQVIFPA